MAHGQCSPKANCPVPSQSLLSSSKLWERCTAGWRCSLGPAILRLCGSEVSGRGSKTCVESPCSLTHSAEIPSPVQTFVQLPQLEAAASLPRLREGVLSTSLSLHSWTPCCYVLCSSVLCTLPESVLLPQCFLTSIILSCSPSEEVPSPESLSPAHPERSAKRTVTQPIGMLCGAHRPLVCITSYLGPEFCH